MQIKVKKTVVLVYDPIFFMSTLLPSDRALYQYALFFSDKKTMLLDIADLVAAAHRLAGHAEDVRRLLVGARHSGTFPPPTPADVAKEVDDATEFIVAQCPEHPFPPHRDERRAVAERMAPILHAQLLFERRTRDAFLTVQRMFVLDDWLTTGGTARDAVRAAIRLASPESQCGPFDSRCVSPMFEHRLLPLKEKLASHWKREETEAIEHLIAVNSHHRVPTTLI